MSKVEELYKNFGILADAGDKAGEHSEAYQFILSSTKGETAEKKLACQFIPRFFKHFPLFAEQAIDAQLDLCEEKDNTIRKLAIKSLPEFCKNSTEHILRISDILTQLLQLEDASEVSIVQNALNTLIEKDIQATMEGIFSQISVGEDVVREKALKFLTNLAATGNFGSDEKSAEVVLQEVKKIIGDVTGDEFTLIIAMLTKVKSIASKPQNLADLITEQAELDKDFQPEPESLNRLITCTRQASPFFIKGASSAKYLDYLFTKVMPVLENIASVEYKLEALKLIVELSAYATEENAKQHIEEIFQNLVRFMPLPAEAVEGESEEEAIKKMNFSYIECWMVTLHKLGGKYSDYLTADEERLKDFRLRLQYCGRMVQNYIRQLRLALKEKSKSELSAEENKQQVAALRTCNTINILIKDLLHNPPSYKSNPVVSWKSKATPIQATNETVEEKRKRAGITPISTDDLTPSKKPVSKKADTGGVYTPPERKKGIEMGDDYTGRKFNRGGGFNNRGRRNSWGDNKWRRKSGGRGGEEEYQNFLQR